MSPNRTWRHLLPLLYRPPDKTQTLCRPPCAHRADAGDEARAVRTLGFPRSVSIMTAATEGRR